MACATNAVGVGMAVEVSMSEMMVGIRDPGDGDVEFEVDVVLEEEGRKKM